MVYTYKCDTCGGIYELNRRISDDKPESFECLCGGTQRRLFDVPQIAFKGIGFYTNDHKDKVKDAVIKNDSS
jgi:putative FmdB family regulatory protein